MMLEALALILVGIVIGGLIVFLASGYEIAKLRAAAEALKNRWRND